MATKTTKTIFTFLNVLRESIDRSSSIGRNMANFFFFLLNPDRQNYRRAFHREQGVSKRGIVESNARFAYFGGFV